MLMVFDFGARRPPGHHMAEKLPVNLALPVPYIGIWLYRPFSERDNKVNLRAARCGKGELSGICFDLLGLRGDYSVR